MTTDLVPAQAGLALAALGDIERLANNWSRSGLIPDALRGKPADIAIVMMTGHELGMTPTQALRGIHVINGRPTLAAELMVALVLRSGYAERFDLIESSDTRAAYETKRKGSSRPVQLTYTIEQAQTAGLAGKGTWKAHPAAMLRARCSAALARAVYSDVLYGIYIADEAEELKARGTVTVTQPDLQPAVTHREDITDAEIVDPVTGEITSPDDMGDPSQPTDQEQIEYWIREIWAAQDKAELTRVGKSLMEKIPDAASPVRVQMREAYAARQKELRQ